MSKTAGRDGSASRSRTALLHCAADRRQSRRWIGAAGGGTQCTPLAPIQRRLWRLSAAQWSNAVRDLLALPSRPAVLDTGRPERVRLLRRHDARHDAGVPVRALRRDPETVLPAIASKIGGASGTIAPCSGTTASAQTACAQSFIQRFAKKAYRRPVDATEVGKLMNVYAQGAMQDYATGDQPDDPGGADLAFVRLPDRARTGDADRRRERATYPDTTLTPYEIATQLGVPASSGSIPDDALIGGR